MKRTTHLGFSERLGVARAHSGTLGHARAAPVARALLGHCSGSARALLGHARVRSGTPGVRQHLNILFLLENTDEKASSKANNSYIFICFIEQITTTHEIQ